MLTGNKRTDASVKYYKDSNIETSLSHLSTSSVAGKESITDCLKQCALTAGCQKAKYGLDSCELKGSDLAHVDGKTFAIKAEQCSGTGYIWQDKNIEFEQIIEYQVPSVTSAAKLVKDLKEENPNFSDWQFGENGVTERNSYRITFEEMPPPSVHPDSSKTLTTGNLWLKFEIDFYIREYTNDELTTEIPLNKSKRTGWWTSNRWRRQSSGGASTTADSVSAELASSTANMNLPAGTTAQPIDPSLSLSSKSPPASTPSCQSGYNLQKRTDGTCADIDECSKGTDNCSESETCKNTDGSFKCEEKLLQKLIRFMMIQQLMTAMQQQEQPIIQVQSPPVSFWSPPKNSQ
ncbi:unnamed protein product [Oikopleura dioica]|uniref:NOTCH1 EGF-like calcium-binding domain-containing protein n=1 Tax=Oikopleura dioica TaxID=34765 RepID=E4YLH3_OIKDI|nr:unnamed protein product [Oikopleura dioica]